jgi:hypothetical protein
VDLAKFQNLLSFKMHPMALKYIMSEAPIRVNIKGNQGGGTSAAMYDVTLRTLGIHPVAKRNTLNKPIRLVSKIVPEGEDDEQNQQYVELRRLLYPLGIVDKKITARNKVMGVRTNGTAKQLEFMASTQELDAFMSVQRSAYYQDEEIERSKWDESLKRLLKEGGDVTLTLTPVKGLDWVFDSIWCRASKIYRSKCICDKFGYPEVEDTGKKTGIEIFCWATDDNPALDAETINRIFENFDDPDELAMARYGVFRQVSGRIYKIFDEKIHKVPAAEVFSTKLFQTYWNYRIIDFHPGKPWYVSFLGISPHNEWFVWHELKQSHDSRTTLELRDEIKDNSILEEDDEFNRCTLIDPLSNMKQGNTGFSTFQDLSMGEYGLRRLTEADTKNNGGRENIKMRLRNSCICGVPGNNINKNDHEESRYGIYLPTLWILDNCPGHVDHFKNWRYVDFKLEHVKATRVVKRESQKFSDYCRNLEFLGNLNPCWYEQKKKYYEPSRLFQGQRSAA